ncbi:hypothetical protein ACFYP4_22795 [Streptomyces sp. NPDC005551]|uniref:hypothetical protein n=1 Tax=unclassified Streptomyces TaxID=2593676 RepID=UPI0033F896A4
MISESHVRELLASDDDDAALVLLEGRAEVVEAALLASDAYRGAPVLLTRGDLAGRLGTTAPSEHEIRDAASALETMAAKIGA